MPLNGIGYASGMRTGRGMAGSRISTSGTSRRPSPTSKSKLSPGRLRKKAMASGGMKY